MPVPREEFGNFFQDGNQAFSLHDQMLLTRATISTASCLEVLTRFVRQPIEPAGRDAGLDLRVPRSRIGFRQSRAQCRSIFGRKLSNRFLDFGYGTHHCNCASKSNRAKLRGARRYVNTT
jgi:hypothetical protein